MPPLRFPKILHFELRGVLIDVQAGLTLYLEAN
jgi:hypothetical protein